MSSKILLIFEGATTEEKVITSIQKFFVNEKTTIKCVYGAEIYQLYKEIQSDPYLDTFSLLKESNTTTKKLLSEYTRNDFAEIYMFFDYDGHSSVADDESLKNLLKFFSEETDKGKLYISYPMVEALKHICDHSTFHNLHVKCKENIQYKKIVGDSCIKPLQHIKRYDLELWKKVISSHLKKMNYLVYNNYSLPNVLVSQTEIFNHQFEKYINITSTVAVLSAFPIFIHDYYGNEATLDRLA